MDGKKFRALREEKGFTPEEDAGFINIDPKIVTYWEEEKKFPWWMRLLNITLNPITSDVRILAERFGMSEEEFREAIDQPYEKDNDANGK